MTDVQPFVTWLTQERQQLDQLTKHLTRCSRSRHADTRRAFLAVQALAQERRVVMAMLGLRDAMLEGVTVC
jgi:hypothetical protein